MKLDEFRKLVRAEFGQGLKHATPANVREFLDHLESNALPTDFTHRIVLNEPCGTYEEVIKDFFSKILDLPNDEAIVALWSLSLYLAFASIESQCADKLALLFQDMD
jgi:hypothetical protein